jgi:hypothetical protein
MNRDELLGFVCNGKKQRKIKYVNLRRGFIFSFEKKKKKRTKLKSCLLSGVKLWVKYIILFPIKQFV